MKKILKVLLVILALIAVGAVVLTLRINSITKAAIEKVAPRITGVPVTLDSVNISLIGGNSEISGLTLGNPDGFKTPRAAYLGRFKLRIEPKSLLSDRIVISEILVEKPEISYELSLRGSNLGKIIRNTERYAPRRKTSSTGDTPGEKQKPADKEPQKKLQIDRVLFTNAVVTLSAFLPDRAVVVNLPSVELKDLGKDEDGLDASEATAVILRRLLEATARAVAQSKDLDKEESALVLAGLKAAEAMGISSEELSEALKKAAEHMDEDTVDSARKAVDVLSDIIGGKEKKKEGSKPKP